MKSKSFVLLCACLLLIATILVQIENPITNGASSMSAGMRQGASLRVVESYGKLPLSFEANRGQTDGEVKFLSRGAGYSLFLTANEAVLELNQSRDREGAVEQRDSQEKPGPLASARGSDQASTSAVLRMKLVGANPSPQVAGADELPGKSNYFIGDDPTKWRTNVPTYAKVRYENVYSGIDLVYYGNQRQLEYDFVVAPGADPRAIRLAFPVSNPSRDREGAVSPRIDPQGDLLLGTAGSELRLHRPVIYQETNGSRQRIDGNFVVQDKNQVTFEVAQYDASKPLIIDPVLSYSTYLGGNRSNEGYGIAVDSAGNAYVTGSTTSADFPRANAVQATYAGGTDAFVAKLNPAGTALVYSTYLGGTSGDQAAGIAVDSSGNAYVIGSTSSFDFPKANPFQATYGGGVREVFVTKLNAAGSALVYSTFLGGSDSDYGVKIAVDSSGSAYVAGATRSTNFPKVNAFQATYRGTTDGFYSGGDAFVAKFNPAGSALVYSTYLGGSSGEVVQGLAVDSSGSAYLTGYTTSTDFPVANAFQTAFGGGSCPRIDGAPCGDAFVTKFNPAGSALVYSTYLGGPGDEAGGGIGVDSSGNAYVAGFTASTNFPKVNAFQAAHGGGNCPRDGAPCGDAFVSKFNPAGSALIYSTYLGGSDDEASAGIAVDSSGNAYVTGYTYSGDFPTAEAFQAAHAGGGRDVFVTKLNAAGSALVYSSYLGGSGYDDGGGIAVDSSGNAYLVGTVYSTDFPTANALQPVIGSNPAAGGRDTFVTKFPAVTPVVLPPPQLTQGSVVNNASYAPGTAAVAPGTIVAIFGTNLTNGTSCLAPSCNPTFGSNGRLNTTMTGAQVAVNGTPAPIFYSSPGQLGVEIPFEVTGASATVQVTVSGQASASRTIAIAPVSPGIFSFTSDGKGAGAITHIDGTPVTQQNPAHAGELVILYATGLGQVNPAVPTGAVPGGASATVAATTLSIDSITVIPDFAGLAGCCVGLNQVNVRLPASTRSANNIPVVLNIGGVASNPVTIAVQ